MDLCDRNWDFTNATDAQIAASLNSYIEGQCMVEKFAVLKLQSSSGESCIDPFAYSRKEALEFAKVTASTGRLPRMIQCSVNDYKLAKLSDYNACERFLERATTKKAELPVRPSAWAEPVLPPSPPGSTKLRYRNGNRFQNSSIGLPSHIAPEDLSLFGAKPVQEPEAPAEPTQPEAPVQPAHPIARHELNKSMLEKLDQVEQAPTDEEALSRAEVLYTWLDIEQVKSSSDPELLHQLSSCLHHLKEMSKLYGMQVSFLNEPEKTKIEDRNQDNEPGAPVAPTQPVPEAPVAPKQQPEAPVESVQPVAPIQPVQPIVRHELSKSMKEKLDQVEQAPTDEEALSRAEVLYLWLDHEQIKSSSDPELLHQLVSCTHHLKEMSKLYAMPVSFLDM